MVMQNLLWSTFLMLLASCIHLALLGALWEALDRFRVRTRLGARALLLLLPVFLTAIFLAHIAEMAVYAGFYIWVGEFSDWEAALYYSASTFTTVGYGDVVLSQDWRLLSALQSATGFLLIGWSTAFLIAVTQRLRMIEHRLSEAD